MVYITTERDGTAGRVVWTGAGVIIKADGTVLTALHVVSGATKITTRFADGTQAGSKIADHLAGLRISLRRSTFPQ